MKHTYITVHDFTEMQPVMITAMGGQEVKFMADRMMITEVREEKKPKLVFKAKLKFKAILTRRGSEGK